MVAYIYGRLVYFLKRYKIYIFICFIQIASGILFNSFEAHYRRVSVVQFTHDGAGLISTSDDSSVSVWSMSRSLKYRLNSSNKGIYILSLVTDY